MLAAILHFVKGKWWLLHTTKSCLLYSYYVQSSGSPLWNCKAISPRTVPSVELLSVVTNDNYNIWKNGNANNKFSTKTTNLWWNNKSINQKKSCLISMYNKNIICIVKNYSIKKNVRTQISNHVSG